MCVDWAKVEPHLAGGDTGNIEHVIDELRLQRDTFGDNIDVLAHIWRQRGVIGERSGEEERGVERCAQLVRERGEEIVLGPRRRFRAQARSFGGLKERADSRLAFSQPLFRLLALGNFRAQLCVQLLRRFGKFMLPHRTEHQCCVHRERLFMELRCLGHLNHDSYRAFIRNRRPHHIRPKDRMRFGMLLLYVAGGRTCTENAIEQRQACFLFQQQFAEWFSHELFHRPIHQAAKGGVDIAHDVAGSLHHGYRQRRVLGDRQAEARQVGRLVCAWGWFLRFHNRKK